VENLSQVIVPKNNVSSRSNNSLGIFDKIGPPNFRTFGKTYLRVYPGFTSGIYNPDTRHDVLTCVGIVNSTVNDIVVVNVVVSFDIDPFIIFGTDDNGFSFANLNVATNDVVTDFTDFFRTAAELSKRI
ncbi:10597_t:CDS:2, partial [Entrophospora sp. SA101]